MEMPKQHQLAPLRLYKYLKLMYFQADIKSSSIQTKNQNQSSFFKNSQLNTWFNHHFEKISQ